jgi:hypothetical protein
MSWNLISGERPLRNRIVRTEILEKEEKAEKEPKPTERFPAWWRKVVDVLRAHPEAFRAVFRVLGEPQPEAAPT